MPFSVQYTAGLTSQDVKLTGNLSFVFNLRGLSERQVDCLGVMLDQFECRRAGAQSDFAYLRGDLSYTDLLGNWLSTLRFAFQMANQPLISNEQFLAGGSDSVRGYFEGEAAGDYGWRLDTEFRTPALFDTGRGQLYGIAFVDSASVALIDAQPDQTSRFTLASIGLGLRLNEARGMQLGLDLARALRDGPRTLEGEGRAHVRLGYLF